MDTLNALTYLHHVSVLHQPLGLVLGFSYIFHGIISGVKYLLRPLYLHGFHDISPRIHDFYDKVSGRELTWRGRRCTVEVDVHVRRMLTADTHSVYTSVTWRRLVLPRHRARLVRWRHCIRHTSIIVIITRSEQCSICQKAVRGRDSRAGNGVLGEGQGAASPPAIASKQASLFAQ